MERFPLIKLARAAVIAALYAAVTFLLAPISYGPVQVRVTEALTVLPIIFPEAIPALFLGCMLANFIGGLGPADVFGGSAVTLAAAYLTYRLRGQNVIIALLPPVLLNAFLISIYLHAAFQLPYWVNVISIGIGQTIAVYGLGLPLLRYLKQRY